MLNVIFMTFSWRKNNKTRTFVTTTTTMKMFEIGILIKYTHTHTRSVSSTTSAKMLNGVFKDQETTNFYECLSYKRLYLILYDSNISKKAM